MEDIIKLWKELKVNYVNFEFTCGGDSMNDTSIQIYDNERNEIQCTEISDYIDNEVYNEVEFYVNSDGHYQGESGNVEIRLSDDEEYLEYSKCSQGEYSERVNTVCDVELDEKTIQFIKDKVLNINGDCDNMTLNYKTDCILTDEEEKIVDELEVDLLDVLRGHEPQEEYEGELGEWFNFTTNEEGNEIVIVGNCLKVEMSIECTVFDDM
jgi:hypothetical protein